MADRAMVANISSIPGGQAAADLLRRNKWDVGVLRPFVGLDGQSYVTKHVQNQQTGLWEPRNFITNAPATLTRDQWKIFDDVVIRTLRDRLKAMSDIRGAGLEYNIGNGMAHTVLSYQTLGDIGRANIGMDPTRRSEADAPTVDTNLFPLPLIYKDFDFNIREIETSQNGPIPLPIDTTTAELATQKVAEEIEMLTTGTGGTFSAAGGTIYGMTNLPERATVTNMTAPTGANGDVVINELLALRQMLIDNKHFGPYMLYVNSQWSEFLDNDFSTLKGDMTLRQRILAIDGIQDVRVLDFLPATKFEMVLLEMQQATVRAVVGMEVMTVQWESMGGMMKHFKVICMVLPQFRPDTAGNSGVAHSKTA